MDVPANQRLWNMLVVQAKAKFPKWPSLPASRWVHQQYVQKGGTFVSEGKAAQSKVAKQNKDEDKDGKKDKKKGEK